MNCHLILCVSFIGTMVSVVNQVLCRLDSAPSSTLIHWTASPPKITLLSHTLIEEAIDIEVGSRIHLRCTGQRPLLWTLPSNNLPGGIDYDHFERYDNTNITLDCDADHKQLPGKCTSDLIIQDAKFDMTGYYSCQYNQTTGDYHPTYAFAGSVALSDTIYIFVNDAQNLIVPYENSTEFMFIAVFQSQPATIPCRPTYSRARVSLWKTHTKNNVAQEIKANSSLGIMYNAKKGFYFAHPRWDSETNILECRYEMSQHRAHATISLHWSILPNELHPIIDDSKARHIFLSNTFTLRCFVHIEIGVIIVIDWDYPNKNDTTRRVFKSHVETQRVNVNGNSYETVSINITVVNATKSDHGDYRCNVTDGNGRTFSAVKKLNIFDEHLPSTVNFTTDFDNTVPMLRNVGEDVRFMVVAYVFPDISLIDLTWFKDGRQLEMNNSHYEVKIFSEALTQISFYIEKSCPSDSGTYTLVGQSSSMSTNISMTVLVRGEPEIVLPNKKDFYVLNTRYHLVCQSYGFPKSVTWWKWLPCPSAEWCTSNRDAGWLDLETSGLYNEAQWQLSANESNLYLNTSVVKVKATQSGLYLCCAQNDFGTVTETIPFIVMDNEHLFAIIASTDEPTFNDTVVITCKASVFQYSSVRWTTAKLHDDVHHRDVTNSTNIMVTNSTNQYSMSLTITMRYIKFEDSAIFTCEATRTNDLSKSERKDYMLIVKNISSPVVFDSNMNDKILDAAYNSQIVLKCYVSGRPWPKIQWFRNGGPLVTQHDSGIKFEERGQRLVFMRLLEKDSALYECRVSNRGGVISRKIYLRVNGYDDMTLQTSELLITMFLAIIGTVMILMAVFIGKKIRQERMHKRELEFFSKNLFENGQMELFNPEMPLDEQIDLLPYDSRFEFPKERLRLGRTLGQGAFGRVVKAEAIGLEDDQSSTTVAVKMLKERADANQRKALMAELKILIHLGRHLNIVNLLGAVTKNLVKGELLVIVEYCEFGNLRHFLMSNRSLFVNQLNEVTGQIDRTIQLRCTNVNGQTYQNVDIVNSSIKSTEYLKNGGAIRYVDLLHQSSIESTNDYINTSGSNGSVPHKISDTSLLAYYNHSYVGCRTLSKKKLVGNNSQYQKAQVVTTSDLLCYAFQCARGMEYLTYRKLIHRDLAARNVLLASNNVVKICDFGLAKDVYKYDNYVKKDDGPLPIKWMAIESISDKVFTSKSDVWSYGILLWELFTLGKNPYPGIEIDEEFYKRLKNGYRMEKPEFASPQIYELMNQCWNANPADRPSFEEISQFVGQMMEDKICQYFIDLNNPYSEMNQQMSNDYLKMTSVCTDSSEEYLKMNEDENADVSSERHLNKLEMMEIKSSPNMNNNIPYDNLHVVM